MNKRLIALLLTVILMLVITYPQTVQANSGGQIGLVVQFGNGNTTTLCVSGDGISGYEVLQRSGLDVVASFSNMGAAVCKIGADGCSADNCFCQHPPHYWSYWQLRNGSWVYSPMGSASQSVPAGSVEGWRWGTGDPPPVIAFESICSPPPTEAPPPTALPEPPTATPLPPTPLPPTPTAQPPSPTVVIVQQVTATRIISTPTSGPVVVSSPTPEDTASPSPSPSATASPTASYTPVITASATPTALAVDDQENDIPLHSGEGSAAADPDNENPASGAPVQYLYFGIITVLMGTILVIFNIYQRKQ
jgi:hypothetical protein